MFLKENLCEMFLKENLCEMFLKENIYELFLNKIYAKCLSAYTDTMLEKKNILNLIMLLRENLDEPLKGIYT